MVLLPLTALALWLLGFRRWQAALARWAPVGLPAGEDEATRIACGRAAARLVDAAARHGLCKGSCLQRSLVLWSLLRRRGLDCDLRIGVRKQAANLQAHAWVAYHGAVLNDGADVSKRYAPFDGAITPALLRG
jgi:hypothetical protein